MILFLKFLLAHILGDFVFQPEKWVKDKEEKKVKSVKLYVHIGVHTVLLLFLLQFNLPAYWLGFLLIVTSHYTIDLLKLYLQKKNTKRIWFFIDQILHVLILFLASALYVDFSLSLENIFTDKIRYIGILERLFVFVFVVTNHWEAIGFLLAAKSVFRFGDLTSSKDRKLTEYILIGTLLSFGIAIFLGVLYLYFLNVL